MSAFTDATMGDMVRVVGWAPLVLMYIGVATVAKWWAMLCDRVLFGARQPTEGRDDG